MQLYYVVFSLNKAEALIFSGTASDDERNDGDMVGGRVSRHYAETAHRRAGLDRRRQ